MTAAEEYTAHHSESLHTIMYDWGWRTFEGMFRKHLLRTAREQLRQMRDLRMAALDANTNMDSKENSDAKQSILEGLQKAYVAGVRVLYSTDDPEKAAQDDYENDPLFAPLARKAQQLHQEINTPLAPQSGMGRDLLESEPA